MTKADIGTAKSSSNQPGSTLLMILRRASDKLLYYVHGHVINIFITSVSQCFFFRTPKTCIMELWRWVTGRPKETSVKDTTAAAVLSTMLFATHANNVPVVIIKSMLFNW
jgi:hypothetical protein